MARGGARQGAGRRKGSVSEATKLRRAAAAAAAVKIAEEGAMPLEIITQVMRHVWDEANAGGRLNIGKAMQAVALAEKAAPYLHSKLATVDNTHSSPDGGPVQTVSMSQDEFRQIAREVADEV